MVRVGRNVAVAGAIVAVCVKVGTRVGRGASTELQPVNHDKTKKAIRSLTRRTIIDHNPRKKRCCRIRRKGRE